MKENRTVTDIIWLAVPIVAVTIWVGQILDSRSPAEFHNAITNTGIWLAVVYSVLSRVRGC